MRPSRITLPRFAVPPHHLYRHLLREASYLPPICATYISARIKDQFRRHRYDKKLATTRITAGRRKLYHLQAANAGDAKRLHSVFLHTFGRTGPLRRTLIAPLVLPDPPATSEAPQTPPPKKDSKSSKVKAFYDKARSDTRHKKGLLDRWDFDKLHHFLQSQVAHAKNVSPAVWNRDRPVKVNPTANIPEQNIWGHDLPLREVRARLKKWWLTNIVKVQPPLGAGEWQTLQELATKREVGQLLRIPPRRPVAVPVHEDGAQTGETWNWQAYASLPTSQIEREREAGFRQTPHGFLYDPVLCSDRRPSNRKLQRAARKVFEASSYIKRDESTAKSEIVWGNLTPDFPVLSSDSPLFAGLDDTGSTPHAGKKQRLSRAETKQQDLGA